MLKIRKSGKYYWRSRNFLSKVSTAQIVICYIRIHRIFRENALSAIQRSTVPKTFNYFREERREREREKEKHAYYMPFTFPELCKIVPGISWRRVFVARYNLPLFNLTYCCKYQVNSYLRNETCAK